jgi:YbbR domain-containing protein
LFKSKKANIVLSILIAVALWAYVVGVVDPETNKTVRDVSVEFVNTDALAESGLALADPCKKTVNIRLVGDRSDIIKLDESKVRAIADVSECEKGSNSVTINARVPGSVSDDQIIPGSVRIIVTRLENARKPVEAKIEGVKEGKKAGNITVSPSIINVAGSKSQIAKVDRIEATLDADTGEGTQLSEAVNAVPVDKKGNRVPYVSAVDSKVRVNATIYDAKIFEYSSSDIAVRGLRDGFKARIGDGSVKASVLGSKDLLKGMVKGDLTLYVDLSGLAEGTHEVMLQPSYDYSIAGVVFSPATVKVEINKE